MTERTHTMTAYSYTNTARWQNRNANKCHAGAGVSGVTTVEASGNSTRSTI